MDVEETKRLLRTFRIVPNKVLGQYFMVEPTFFSKLIEYARLSRDDVVLDVGAGFGFLTRFMALRCRGVVAVEKDPRMVKVLLEQVKGLDNVTVIEGDVLKASLPDFSKVVAIPPYYLSSSLVVWLLERRVECAVLILQREFAERLVAVVGSEDYGWLTVVACHRVETELLDAVPKSMFYPQPEVDSVIVRLMRRGTILFDIKDEVFFKRMVRWLFTQRNKKLGNALAPFLRSALKMPKEEAKNLADTFRLGDRRVRELSPRDFGELANALSE